MNSRSSFRYVSCTALIARKEVSICNSWFSSFRIPRSAFSSAKVYLGFGALQERKAGRLSSFSRSSIASWPITTKSPNGSLRLTIGTW